MIVTLWLIWFYFVSYYSYFAEEQSDENTYGV